MRRIDHLLWILSEECAEVAQRASKMARFGVAEIQPGQSESNRVRLAGELVDLMAMVAMLQDEGVLTAPLVRNLPAMLNRKRNKVEKYLRYSRKMGTLGGEA